MKPKATIDLKPRRVPLRVAVGDLVRNVNGPGRPRRVVEITARDMRIEFGGSVSDVLQIPLRSPFWEKC